MPDQHRIRDGLRFVAVTLALTFAYLGLQAVWESLTDISAKAGLFPGAGEAGYADEAKQLAARSAEAEARLPASHRVDAWRLGYLLGYETEWIGSFALSAPDRQQKVREVGAPLLARANAIATALGVGPVDVIPVRTLADFGNLTTRVETDDTGIAQRVTTRLSPRAGHLFLLGMQTGIFVALLEGVSEADPLPIPQTTLIAKHATLAGVDPALWKPLQRVPSGDTRKQVVERYRATVNALDGALVTGGTTVAPAAKTP